MGAQRYTLFQLSKKFGGEGVIVLHKVILCIKITPNTTTFFPLIY